MSSLEIQTTTPNGPRHRCNVDSGRKKKFSCACPKPTKTSVHSNCSDAALEFKRKLVMMEGVLGRVNAQVLGISRRLSSSENLSTNPNVTSRVVWETHTQGELQSHREKIIEQEQTIDRLKSELQSTNREFQKDFTRQNQEQQKLIADQQQRIHSLEFELSQSKHRNEELDRTKENFELELKSTKQKLLSMEEKQRESQMKLEDLESLTVLQKAHIETLENNAREDEALRRKLHNTIQELRGNIRVICRIRPLIGSESAESVAYEYSQRNPQELVVTSTDTGRDLSKLRSSTTLQSDQQFKFDRVFGPEESQATVFDEISQLVQSSLDGYNCCIFAYGQTGSGKTFTMEGPANQSERSASNEGMIQRAVSQIFESATQLKNQGWKFEFTATFLEIYNETIRDLLVPAETAETTKYDIRHDTKTGITTVSNLSTSQVHTPKQVYDLLRIAHTNRSTASTNMNEHSSRSHFVFQLFISGVNTSNNDRIEGLLNLIDLAGSERLDSTGTTGINKKETIHINSSLSNLSACIQALGVSLSDCIDSHPQRMVTAMYLIETPS